MLTVLPAQFSLSLFLKNCPMNSHKGFSTRSISFCNKHEVSKLLLWTYGIRSSHELRPLGQWRHLTKTARKRFLVIIFLMQITVFVIQTSLGFTPNLNNNMKEKMKWILIAKVKAANGLLKSIECHLNVKSVLKQKLRSSYQGSAFTWLHYTFSARQWSLVSV